MKVRIEVLKAPWPVGAKVGDVVEIAGDRIPASIIGKCVKVDDGTPATVAYPKAEEKKAAK